MVLGAGFLQGFMSDLGFAFYGYRKWTLSVLALSGALAPLLQQIPEVYFGVGDMGISYNLLALAIRMVSGAVYAIILVKPIAHALARAGVLRGTAIASAEAPAGCRALRPSRDSSDARLVAAVRKSLIGWIDRRTSTGVKECTQWLLSQPMVQPTSRPCAARKRTRAPRLRPWPDGSSDLDRIAIARDPIRLSTAGERRGPAQGRA